MTIVNTGNVSLVKGMYKEIVLQVVDQDGNPQDVTGAGSLKCRFCKADGTLLELTTDVTILSAVAGKFKVVLSAANTDLLLEGDSQMIELEYTISGQKTIVQFENALTVKKKLTC
jgi:hypothetical protein